MYTWEKATPMVSAHSRMENHQIRELATSTVSMFLFSLFLMYLRVCSRSSRSLFSF
jgi:hypothetical protein